jgi:AmmeMemoRadiSam system protein B
MKALLQKILWLMGLISVFYIPPMGRVVSADDRPAVLAGTWYPGSKSALEKRIQTYTDLAQKNSTRTFPRKALKALIIPHAGIDHAGPVAAYSGLVLRERQFGKIILLGPDHYVGFTNGAVSAVEAYATPLGRVDLHPEARELVNRSSRFRTVPESDRYEHSLEMVLIFLQYYLNDFRLIPIVLGPAEIEEMTNELQSLLNNDTLLVISSDLSHFLSSETARKKDKATIDMILTLQAENILLCQNCACGKIPLTILLKIAHRLKWKPVLLKYANSGDTSGNKSRVVGYTTIAFYGD